MGSGSSKGKKKPLIKNFYWRQSMLNYFRLEDMDRYSEFSLISKT